MDRVKYEYKCLCNPSLHQLDVEGADGWLAVSIEWSDGDMLSALLSRPIA